MKRGIYAGSFDPISLGHLDVVRRASLILDEIHVMIGVNPKKSAGLFDVEQRTRLIRDSLDYMNWFGRHKDAFIVGNFTCLLVEYCQEHEVKFNIRGLRAAQDFNSEFEMHLINCDIAPGIDTIFLPAPPEFQFLSSSAIKELASHNSPAVRKYVTPTVADALKNVNV
jgi:pantetheine-phosphate adenylyltransferase